MPGASLSYIPYPSAFVPTSIPGCVLWMDAADPLGTGVAPTNGATVSSWIDKSGNGYNSPANTTGATFNTNVQNGYGALTFTSGQYYITPTLVLSSTNTPTVFLVCIQTGGGGNSEIVVCGIGRALYLQLDLFQKNGTLRLDMYGNGSESGSIPISSPTFITLIGYGSPTYTATMWGNGTSNVTITGSSANPVSTPAQYLIGACSGFVGIIYEVLFYNTAFTTTQQQQVEGYLAWKWGLQANLPGGHPYASAAPTTPNSLGISRPAISLALAPTGVRSLGNAPYTTTFRPTSVPGCQLWLDAADATTFTITSGSNVSTWSDKSGSNSSLSNTTSNPPYFTTYNGYPTVSFRGSLSGTSNVLSNQTFSVAPANISIFIVTQALQNGSTFIYPGILTIFPNPLSGVDYRNGFSISGGNATTQILSVYGGGTGNTITGIDYSGSGLTPRGVYSVVNTTNILYAYANGTQWGTNTFTFDATNVGIALGMRHLGSLRAEGGASAYDGNISEVIVYNTALTTIQRQQIEGYLAWKWGLQASLPQSLAPPFTNPTTIPGCILWLDATDPLGTGVQPANGTTLTTWKDKSVSNFPFTSVGSAYNTTAVNGLPGMTLSTNFIGYDPGSAQNNWQEVFAVGLWTGGSTFNSYNGFVTTSVDSDGGVGGGILFIGNAGSTNWWGPGNTYVQQIINGTQTGSAFPAIQTPFIARTFSATAVNLRGLRFGIDRSFTDRKWVGFISEVICYNTALTATQRLQVEGYLAWKWVSQANLVNTHTYYSASPAHSHSAAAPTGASLRPALSAALVPAGVRGLAALRKLQSYTQTFSYTGANQTFPVPATTTSLTVHIWGAGGGGGHTGTQGATAGGAGAYVQGTLTVTPNNSLTIIVGGGGTHGSVGVAYGGGGSANAAGTYGGGGGRSAIQLSGTELVDAGGGGGAGYDASGGYANFSPTINGGAGYPGLTGASWPFDSGAGGTQTAGGAGGPGNASSYGVASPGTYLAGGAAAPYAGGGGSGYYGGGGGNTNDTNGAGGGGGSSYTTNPAFTLITGSNSSNGYSAPASASPYYASGVAAGSTNMTTGGNGRIVLVYLA